MIDTLTVRSATADDVQAVRDVLVATWHATYDDIYGRQKVAEITASWHSLPVLAEQLTDPTLRRLVAIRRGAIAGTVLTGVADSREIRLHQLYVVPGCHGLGIGGRLLTEAIAAYGAGVTVTLEVEPRNEAAVSFYRRHGFEDAGEVANCGRNDSGIRAIVMRKVVIGV